MPLFLIFHAAVACATVVTRLIIAPFQQILTDSAVARADARWLAMAASGQQDPR